MNQLPADFLAKAADSLTQLDHALSRLEHAPQDWDALILIFRKVHAIRTGAAALPLPRLQQVLASVENVLSRMRDGLLGVTPDLLGVMFAARDRVRELLTGLAETGHEQPGDDAVLLAAMANLCGAGPGVPPAGTVAIAPVMVNVSVDLLDDLVALAGELMLVRNQLIQNRNGSAPGLHRLSQITAALHDGVMKTRMQPIRAIWTGMPELLRELASQYGKKIELVVRGADTELDRHVLQLLRDPLLELVRNCVEHGLESPEERRAAGKPETGRVTLRARHEGAHVTLEVADNGRGLNTERLRRAVVAAGLASEADLAAPGGTALRAAIFESGLSATDDAGRGAGLDKVARGIEAVGGTISVKTAPNSYTSFIIRVPPSLALYSAAVLEAGKDRFGIPRASVERVIPVADLTRGADGDAIEWIDNDTPVLRLDGRLLPLVALADLLQLPDGELPEDGGQIAVITTGVSMIGLLVNRVLPDDEIVARPATVLLRQETLFAGTTVQQDGSVISILDPAAIARACNVDLARDDKKAVSEHDEQTALLVFRAGGGDLRAVPLGLVARVDQVPVRMIHRQGDRMAMRRQGTLVPLIPLFGATPAEGAEEVPVLIFADGDRSIGLLIDDVVEVVQDNPRIELDADAPGLLGRGMIADRPTDVIDASYWLKQAWHDTMAQRPAVHQRVLVVEDSSFLCHNLIPALTEAGYHVRVVDSAARALVLRDAGLPFDLIISDLQMPDMDGAQFLHAIRDTEGEAAIWAKVPVIGLSRQPNPDLPQDTTAGFADIVAKLDSETLLRSVSRCLEPQTP